MEICGGTAGVTKVLIRRGLKNGKNMDIVIGADLTDIEHRRYVAEYIKRHKPKVIVMGPPCTAFGGYSRINKLKSSEQYRKQRRIGTIIADFCADIAEFQLKEGRHFLLENPAGSDLFKLPSWDKVISKYNLPSINFSQCSLGLVDPDGIPVKKPTTLLASQTD